MKLMVISDIHGSFTAVEKAVEIFKEEKADKLLILGDVLYHGPRNDLPSGYAPKQVFEALNAIKDKIICVRGNCDAEVDQMVLDFPIMSDYTIFNLGDKTIFATHGHKLETEFIDFAKTCNLALSGHTHLYKMEKVENTVFVNPGSISLPKEGNKPTYAIIDVQKLFLKLAYKVYIKDLEMNTIMSSDF